MNLQIVGLNIREALSELNDINELVVSGEIEEAEFQVAIQHVYHHLNVAWNARNESTESYSEMSDANFEKWGNFPQAL